MEAGFFQSLRGKLIAVFLLVGLVPLSVVGAVAYRKAATSLRAEAGASLTDLAGNAVDKLDRNLFERYGDVQAYAKSEPAKALEPKRLQLWLNTMMITYTPIYTLMVVADAQGKIVAANTVDVAGGPLDTRSLLGVDVGGQDWFRTAVSGQLADGQTFVEDLHEDSLVGRVYGQGPRSHAMSFSYPIRDDAGKIVGVWTNRFNWKVGEQIVHDMGEAARRAGKPSARVILTNKEGTILVGPEASDTLKKNLGGSPIVQRALVKGASGFDDTEGLDRPGEQMVGYEHSAGFSTYPGVNWSAVAIRDRDEALAEARALRSTTLVTGLLAAILIALVAFFMAAKFTRPIVEVSTALHQLATAEADLARRLTVSHEDEVGLLARNFNLFMDRLAGLISQVIRSGIQVTQSTTQIAAGAKELEATVTEQVAATNEVVAAAREISATSTQLAKTMTEVSSMSEATSRSAHAGQADLGQMQESMATIEEASRSVSSKLGAINEKAGNISTVVTTITKVADQTNLLSLNAAIEAEKAGQYGQGFAVVAREIRRLADQTAVATLDIEKMVKDMKSAVVAGVMSMEKFSQQVGEAVGAVTKVSTQLAGIIEQVRAVTSRFEAVDQGMQSQSEAAGQISGSMAQLSETTQYTATALRETNRSIEALNDAARTLQGMVSRFHTT